MLRHGPVRERCEILAVYLVKNNATVRNTAKRFGISKSTVHKDITERLKSVNRGLFEEAAKVLDKNKSERHIRGGIATKNKYIEIRKKQRLNKGALNRDNIS